MTGKWGGLTSKAMIIVVITAGLWALFQGTFSTLNNLVAYGVLLLAAVINRIDSRRGAYKASISTSFGQAAIEAGAAEEDETKL